MPLTTENFHLKPSTCSQALALTCSALFDGRSWDSNLYPQVAQDLKFTSLTQYLFAIQADWPCYYLIPSLNNLEEKAFLKHLRKKKKMVVNNIFFFFNNVCCSSQNTDVIL